jgi:Flp pilus assembly protein TadD
MSWKDKVAVSLTVLVLGFGLRANAGDLKIKVPRRSHMTPVQKLNREGVEAVRNHHYDKAESLFFKAYLLDPDDPFTLNNLGYVAEIQGQVDRAQKFYTLATKQPTDAIIDLASSKRVQGHPVMEALFVPRGPIQINHDNVEAVRLLSEKRAPEADILLQNTLKSDPQNIFTLNNMGVAKEMEGESQEALKYYDEAATSGSDAAAVVTLNRSWRGRPVHEMAAQNARRLRNRLSSQESDEIKIAELNLRGVSAVNRNDLKSADQDFRSAYAIDPNNPFALNNIGFVSEIEGDPETAQFFYDKARTMGGANVTVGLATRGSAQGQKLFQVATDSDSKVEEKVTKQREALRQQREPIVLRHRDGTVVDEPATPVQQNQPPQ